MAKFNYESQLDGTRDFVRGERFIFKTPACKCEVRQATRTITKIKVDSEEDFFVEKHWPASKTKDEESDTPEEAKKEELGTPEETKEYETEEETFDVLVITKAPEKKEHLYVYAPQNGGLVGYDEETDDIKQDVTPLDELLGLQSKDGQLSQEIARYIEKYGFFWPVEHLIMSDGALKAIDSDELYRYIQPLCKLHELLENLAIADTSARHLINYDRIFELTLFYIFYCRKGIEGYLTNGRLLSDKPGDRASFESFWWNLSGHPLYEESPDENYENDMEKPNIIPPQRKNVIWHSSSGIDKVAMITRKLEKNPLIIIETRDESLKRKNEKSDLANEISYVIWYLYKHIPLEYAEARKVVDFLYIFIKRVSKISYIDSDGNIEIQKKLKNNIDFNEELKEKLIEIAKIVCKRELDWGIKNIRPIYDIEEKRPDWEIPDLYSGLYFAHFYCDAKYYIRRKCQSPACNKYFLVRRTNTKKKYCDTCKGTVQKINKRQEKLKENE